METPPVLFLVFNRPDLTQKVFERIREVKPKRLFVAADGPRPDVPGDVQLCSRTRQIIEKVNWICEIKTLFREDNLGCKNAVSSAIDWFFEHVEAGIILEDDCLPHQTFFRYCGELLEYYKDDPRVMHISGDNFLQGRHTITSSYYFSKYPHVWGWATWRRAWLLFHEWDKKLSGLDIDFRIFKSQSERNFWLDLLEQLQSHRMDYTWDYQWALTCLANKALCVMPKSNLVSNIGFGQDATHTQGNSWLANLPVTSMDFPLIHPVAKSWDTRADQITGTIFFNVASKSTSRKLIESFRRIIPGIKKIEER